MDNEDKQMLAYSILFAITVCVVGFSTLGIWVIGFITFIGWIF